MARVQRYGVAQRLLHWLTVLLVLALLLCALGNSLVYEGQPVLAETLVQIHMSLGATVFLLTLARALLRQLQPPPALPESLSAARAGIARGLHLCLYLLLLAIPVTGYLKLAWLGFEIRLFDLITLPSLALDIEASALARRLHWMLAISLTALLATHIAAALQHRHRGEAMIFKRMTFG
ncbi:MAG: cytochrome b/b6 domain-containing protein [Pseudomonadota bacterium]